MFREGFNVVTVFFGRLVCDFLDGFFAHRLVIFAK